MNQYKDMPIELTDTELAQIQGGGWLGDAWNFPKPRPWPPVYY